MAVGSYSSGPPAWEIAQFLIFKTLRMTALKYALIYMILSLLQISVQEQNLAVEMPSGDDSADSAVKDDLKFGQWDTNDHCRAVSQDDGIEYEATVQSVEADGEGKRYATVRSQLY